MILNTLAGVFLIVMSFVIRSVSEDTIGMVVLTWTMFISGCIVLFLVLLFIFKKDANGLNDGGKVE